MKIYVDENKRVKSVDVPIEGLEEIELSENEPFFSISTTRKLCCYYDNTSFYYAIPHDIADMLDAKQQEIDTLNSVIDVMIITELEGGDLNV